MEVADYVSGFPRMRRLHVGPAPHLPDVSLCQVHWLIPRPVSPLLALLFIRPCRCAHCDRRVWRLSLLPGERRASPVTPLRHAAIQSGSDLPALEPGTSRGPEAILRSPYRPPDCEGRHPDRAEPPVAVGRVEVGSEVAR